MNRNNLSADVLMALIVTFLMIMIFLMVIM